MVYRPACRLGSRFTPPSEAESKDVRLRDTVKYPSGYTT